MIEPLKTMDVTEDSSNPTKSIDSHFFNYTFLQKVGLDNSKYCLTSIEDLLQNMEV